MKTSTVGALAVRIIGGVCCLADLSSWVLLPRSIVGPSEVVGGSDRPLVMFTHISLHPDAAIVGVLVPVVLGIVMILFSRPIGRFIAKGLPEE